MTKNYCFDWNVQEPSLGKPVFIADLYHSAKGVFMSSELDVEIGNFDVDVVPLIDASIKQGELFYVEARCRKTIGHLARKKHPYVIVANDENNFDKVPLEHPVEWTFVYGFHGYDDLCLWFIDHGRSLLPKKKL